jgi:hypothetical protein
VILYQSVLCDAKFLELLRGFDAELAALTRAAGCACGGVLHLAAYDRKPRGMGSRGTERRASFCCAREGCRRRATPASLLFLGRRVFFGVVVLLVPALRQGPSRQTLAELEALYGITERTLLRWRKWWRETFVASSVWRAGQGLFRAPVRAAELPGSLLEAFDSKVEAVLRFLSPLSNRTGKGLAS